MGGINWDYCPIKQETRLNNSKSECDPAIIEIDYKYYSSYAGLGQPSGHYIFRSDTKRPKYLIHNLLNTYIYHGKLVQQITLVYDTLITQVRIFKSRKKGFEVESIFPPNIDDEDDENGKEVIITIKPSFTNDDGIYILYIYIY